MHTPIIWTYIVQIYTYTYTYIHIYTYKYIHTYTHISTYTYTHIYRHAETIQYSTSRKKIGRDRRYQKAMVALSSRSYKWNIKLIFLIKYIYINNNQFVDWLTKKNSRCLSTMFSCNKLMKVIIKTKIKFYINFLTQFTSNANTNTHVTSTLKKYRNPLPFPTN